MKSKKNKKRKSSRWCSVPQCKFVKDISLHKFPKNRKVCNQWVIACKIGKKITSNMFVCAAHFTRQDYMPRLNTKHPSLKPLAVPSLNLPKRPLDRVLSAEQLKQKFERLKRFERRSVMNEINDESISKLNTSVQATAKESLDNHAVENDSLFSSPMYTEETIKYNENVDASDDTPINVESCICYKEDEDENDYDEESAEVTAARILLELKTKHVNVQKANMLNCESELSSGNLNVFPSVKKVILIDLLKTDDDLKVFTGINNLLLNNLINAVKLCEKKSYQYVYPVKERIVLTLCKLKLNLSFKCLAILFGMSRHTCSNIFLTMLQTLAFILKSAIYWPTKEQILKSMPKCFKKFSKTYVVLDCTEIPIERPKCLRCRLRLYSHYKGCETIKFLVGISPSGLIIFISEAYGGRASDKSIFNQSKILNKLEPTRDGIMVDKGFAIEEECAEAHITLFVPPKLGKNKQFCSADVTSTIEIASARVHVERSIQRIKLFDILKKKISIKIAPYMNEIFTVVCGIVNLSESIMSDHKFE